MPFRSVAAVADAEATQGCLWRSHVWKASTPATAGNYWADSSVGTGTPVYNAYVGAQYEFTPLTGSGNRSIYPGPGLAAGQTRHVAQVMAQTSSNINPLYLVCADYLGFYPLIDTDSLDVQTMDNTATLPRYTDGDGVRAFLVVQVPQTLAATASCTVNYTNQAGTAGRSVTFGLHGNNVIGALCNQGSSAGVATTVAMAPFIPMQSGDRGIRSVQSVSLSAGVTGFVNLVLCRPLFDVMVPVTNIAAEKHLLMHNAKLPRVETGAFLHFLLQKNNAGSVQLMAQLDFIWS